MSSCTPVRLLIPFHCHASSIGVGERRRVRQGRPVRPAAATRATSRSRGSGAAAARSGVTGRPATSCRSGGPTSRAAEQAGRGGWAACASSRDTAIDGRRKAGPSGALRPIKATASTSSSGGGWGPDGPPRAATGGNSVSRGGRRWYESINLSRPAPVVAAEAADREQ